MKKLIFTLIFSKTIIFYGQVSQDSVNSQKQEETMSIETMVDEMPSFPGGEIALKKFIIKNLIVPPVVKEKKLIGGSFLKIVVNKDGTIGVIKVVKPMEMCPECDDESIKLIRTMPKWTPAKKGGKTVAAYWNLKIDFPQKK
jgi:protein TonB